MSSPRTTGRFQLSPQLRWIWGGLWLLAATMVTGIAWAAPAGRPNIVFIMVDDMGWNAPACCGNRDVATPNLDRLAAEGMRFSRAYADAQCSPTRAALLSGQYGARTGLFRVIHEKDLTRARMMPPVGSRALTPDQGCLGRVLKEAGYVTGMSGKWHVADNYNAAPLRTRDGGHYFKAYGFDFVGDLSEGNPEKDRQVDAITHDMLEFIESNRERTFFAYLAHHVPHTPMEAPRELIQKHIARGYVKSTSPVCKTGERPTADYLAMIEHFDNSLGRVMTRLEELGLARDTILIFYSDNGGLGRMASMAPLRESKGSPYEGGIRVPLIVRWPGRIAAGSLCDVPVHTVDLFPTFVQLAGGQVPPGHALDGESLVPLFRRTGGLRREALYWHMPTYTPMYARTPCSVVLKGDWKLIHWFGDYLDTEGAESTNDGLYGRLVLGSRTELFDLRADPSETTDLAPRHPGKVLELRALLEDWWRETGAELPTENPEFDPATWWRSS